MSEEVIEKKQRSYKRMVYGSTPYAFRLSGRTENEYRKELNSWIEHHMNLDHDLSPSQALKIVVKGLIEEHLGRSLDAVAVSASIDVESLKTAIIDELKGWLADTLASPEKAAHLAHVSNMAASGEEIGSDVIDNILEDFGR